jgi:hypothetical protein
MHKRAEGTSHQGWDTPTSLKIGERPFWNGIEMNNIVSK